MDEALGKHWILLRGLARESAHWGDFVPLLQDAFPASRISLIDLLGTGCYYRKASPCSIRAIVESVRGDALAKGWLEKPVSILGLSLGAMVAWEWLSRHPEDIAGEVLMNTSFADLSPFYMRLRRQSYRDFAELAMTRDIFRRESRIVRLVSNRKDRYEATIEEWSRIQKARPISTKNALRQIVAAATYKPSHSKPQQPVLLLNGQGDRLVSPVCSEAIHKKWRIELRAHPWAGHDLTLDDGGWVATQIQDWVFQRTSCIDREPEQL
ncbi:alpha/beta fold hydrolase [Methylotuvimicrobium alcaliphilum]|uniref:alpha/beta fold hydrolase n=1 Tax=Methylotuvimicrobium alcaliphilum TaxID=271065 RepID=UPI003B58E73F